MEMISMYGGREARVRVHTTLPVSKQIEIKKTGMPWNFLILRGFDAEKQILKLKEENEDYREGNKKLTDALIQMRVRIANLERAKP